MRTEKAECDLCVIGGGMAGICAAVSAARKGLSVILIQDRNVLGGNASGEIRMWIRGAGAAFPEYKEGGLIEELALDNMYYNPSLNYSLWDAVLYNKVVMEKNIRLLLGTTCIGATCENNKITGVRAWQLASYVTYEIKADYFSDCSGDCILAEFTDAETMQDGKANTISMKAPPRKPPINRPWETAVCYSLGNPKTKYRTGPSLLKRK